MTTIEEEYEIACPECRDPEKFRLGTRDEEYETFRWQCENCGYVVDTYMPNEINDPDLPYKARLEERDLD